MRQRRQHTDSRRAAQTDGETPQKPTQTDTEKGADTMTTTEREALDRINRRQNAANLFTNIGPAEITAEIEAMKEETPATPAEAAQARAIIRRIGGYREREIMKHPHTMTRSTWTEQHRVIEILSTTPDPDGYRPGCEVDLLTKSIVG